MGRIKNAVVGGLMALILGTTVLGCAANVKKSWVNGGFCIYSADRAGGPGIDCKEDVVGPNLELYSAKEGMEIYYHAVGCENKFLEIWVEGANGEDMGRRVIRIEKDNQIASFPVPTQTLLQMGGSQYYKVHFVVPELNISTSRRFYLTE